ncbi:MAG: hypothetical protein AB7J35_07950 [Dehalococcoidia bacterium]
MRRNRFIATVAAGLGIIALIPVATALGDDSAEPAGQAIQDVTALGSGFTYQGRLTDAGSPANGTYDLRFILYDAETAGAAVGSTQTKEDVNVTNGLFSVELDFGNAAFNGDARWVELAVRPGASAGTFTVLSPRQPISPTPYALFAKAAAGIAVPFAATGSSAGAAASTTGLFTVTQSGTGIAVAGNRTSTEADEYPGVLGTNSGGGAGVQGESTYVDGVAVRGFAVGANGTGGYFSGETGIEVDGPVKVSGATPSAFVHTVDIAGGGQNTCPADDTITILTNPLTDGDPSALVFVTLVDPTGNGFNTLDSAIAVVYDSDACEEAADKWSVYTTASGGVDFTDGLQMNVLVIQR